MSKKGNIFDKAAKKTTTAKKSDNMEIHVPKLEDTLTRMAEINAMKAELEAEYAELDDEVRTVGKTKMMNEYNSNQKFPGTLQMIAGTMGYQFITSDKYKKVDSDRAEELRESWGEDIVTEDTVYSFNTTVLMKYMDHISDLLMGSKKVADVIRRSF